MEFSIRRVNALFKKEVKDLGKNKNVLIMFLLPIFFSIIYSKMLLGNASGSGIGKIDVLTMCLGLNVSMVSSFSIAMMIAEEREKNTLRTLMLSAVSPWEFLAGKTLITFLVSVIINIIMFFIVGIDAQYLAQYILLTSIVVLSMIEIGATIGIISPNQMSTGVVGMPVVMVFLLVPFFVGFSKSLKRIAEFLPNYNMNVILGSIVKGNGIGAGAAYKIGVILAWILIGAIVFAFTYNKKGFDK
jgi:ABC-2 type transport system permease protein